MAICSPARRRSPSRSAAETRLQADGHGGENLRTEGAAYLLLDGRVEREQAQISLGGKQRPDPRAPERLAHGLDQQYRMFGNGGGIQQSFEDGGQVPHRNLFPQQLLQYFLHLSLAQNLGRQFFDKFRLAVRKAVEQALGSCRVSNWYACCLICSAGCVARTEV